MWELDRARHLHRLEQPPVVGHEQQRALVAVERLLELLDGGQVEVVGGLVEHEAVHARADQQREHGAGALAGRQRAAPAAATCSAPSPNLASSERASLGSSPVAAMNASSSGRRRPRTRRAPGPSRPRRRRDPSTASPAASGSSAEQRVEQRRLAASRSARRSPTRSRPSDLEVDRTETERAALDHGAVEPEHDVAAPRARSRARGAAPSPPTACRPTSSRSSALLGDLHLRRLLLGAR